MHKTAQNEAWLSGLEAWSMTWKGQLVRAHLLDFCLLSFAPVLGNFEELWPRADGCTSLSPADSPRYRSVQLRNNDTGKIQCENVTDVANSGTKKVENEGYERSFNSALLALMPFQ